jgi:uncharacterized Fe-S cluster protein YjdI
VTAGTDGECETPTEAGVPATTGLTREYATDGIAVIWNATRCIHSARCIRGLPEVFDTQRRPWIDPSAAAPAEVAAVIERCPTGALTYRRAPGLTDEQPADPTTVQVRRDGPLFVRGRIQVVDAAGQVIATVGRALPVRCEREQAVLRQQPPAHRVPRLTHPSAPDAAPARLLVQSCLTL